MSKKEVMSTPASLSGSFSSVQWTEQVCIFDELPTATVVFVSRPETGDISSLLLSYKIELRYKQFSWILQKRASQVLDLHIALKKRKFIEDFIERQEQIKEWLQNLGLADQITIVQANDETDDETVPLRQDGHATRNRGVPSAAALSIIRPTLRGQQVTVDRAKIAMQGYLNHLLGNIDTVNSREVCKFLEVSRLSFLQEYGPKLKEGYVRLRNPSKLPKPDADTRCGGGNCFCNCNKNVRKVWAVLKHGFLAFLNDPCNSKLLDIIVFEVVPSSKGNEASPICLADKVKECNPLRYTFKVSSGNRIIRMQTTSSIKLKEWIHAINDAGLGSNDGWCHPNRFCSFSPPRGLTEDGSQAQWFIDAQAAFEAIASSIKGAKSEIFMTGWWLCPDLYLKRPFGSNSSYRLDALIEERANQGVQIYILLFKEVTLALKLNSFSIKNRLSKIHGNVKVLRYPDHFATGVYLWSHHEKLVIVDHRIAYIGGLDLCFGRYDTPEHKVGDFPSLLWPGKDYYNPRESEPHSWEDVMKDELDRKKYPRMPWHDVHCAVWGPPCRDIARHFVQRWNRAKRAKAPQKHGVPLLIPHHHMVIPRYTGRSEEIINSDTKSDEDDEDDEADTEFRKSLSSQLSSVDIPLLLPQEDSLFDNTNAKSNDDQQSEVCESLPHSPQVSEGASGDAGCELDSSEVQLSVKDSEESSGVADEKNCEVTTVGFQHVGPQTTCRLQIVRSVSQWSAGSSQTEDSIHKAYCSLIERAEHFIYIENQFFISGLSEDEVIQNRILQALYERILRAHEEENIFRVVIVLPLLPAFQGGLDDAGAATVRAVTHWQYRTISRGKSSILHNLKTMLGPKADDYISFYGLRSHGRLYEDGPVATSQVYVHSKMMIIDDRFAILGSSNINDRSLLGSRDSEIAIVIEDKDFVDSSLNGEPWKAGKFTHSLRCSLWAEHLGLHPEEVTRIRDPVSEATYKDLWSATAKENTRIYEQVFACIPSDQIRTRGALRKRMNHLKEKLGQTTIDLGIAPQKLESSENGETKETDTMDVLNSVRGHLVVFPLEFLRQEDLRPFFSESEYYVSPQVYQ